MIYSLGQVLSNWTVIPLPEAYLSSKCPYYHKQVVNELLRLLGDYQPNVLNEEVFVGSQLMLSSNVVQEKGSTALPDTWTFFLSAFVNNACVPYRSSQLPALVSDVLREVATCESQPLLPADTTTLASEAVLTTDALAHPSSTSLCWFNTPVATAIYNDYEDYLIGLTKSRRYKQKQLLKTNQHLTMQIVDHANEELRLSLRLTLDRAFVHLQLRWADDTESYDNTVLQWLMGHACVTAGLGFYLQALEDGVVVSTACFIYHPATSMLTFQGIAGTKDLGSFMLVKLMEMLINRNPLLEGYQDVKIVDPCCANGFQDVNDPYLHYKRLIVNTDAYKPVVLASSDAEVLMGAYPPYYNAVTKQWTISNDPPMFDPC